MTHAFAAAGEGRPFSVGPSQVRIKVDNADPAGAFSLIEWIIPPGAPAPPRHVHRRASETFYVIEGELHFPLADETLAASSGSCLHVPAGTPHTLSNPGSIPARALELFVPGSLMGLVEGVGELLSQGPPDMDAMRELFARYDSELVF
ncbi:MAG: cupin domain-containing protein [Actinomycetota bacterium]|nr:cupin domain-containing protein [Actinomycetota bacterium]